MWACPRFMILPWQNCFTKIARPAPALRTTNGRPYKEWDVEGAVPYLFPFTYYFLLASARLRLPLIHYIRRVTV